MNRYSNEYMSTTKESTGRRNQKPTKPIGKRITLHNLCTITPEHRSTRAQAHMYTMKQEYKRSVIRSRCNHVAPAEIVALRSPVLQCALSFWVYGHEHRRAGRIMKAKRTTIKDRREIF